LKCHFISVSPDLTMCHVIQLLLLVQLVLYNMSPFLIQVQVLALVVLLKKIPF